MLTFTKGGRTVEVSETDRQLQAYYRGEGWAVQGETSGPAQPAVVEQRPAPAEPQGEAAGEEPAGEPDPHPSPKPH